jgi:hypothetical protein
MLRYLEIIGTFGRFLVDNRPPNQTQLLVRHFVHLPAFSLPKRTESAQFADCIFERFWAAGIRPNWSLSGRILQRANRDLYRCLRGCIVPVGCGSQRAAIFDPVMLVRLGACAWSRLAPDDVACRRVNQISRWVFIFERSKLEYPRCETA